MKAKRIFIVSMISGVGLSFSTRLMAGGEGGESSQGAMERSHGLKRLSQLLHRSSSTMSSTSSDLNHHSNNSLIVGSSDSHDSSGSLSSKSASKIKSLKRFLSRSSRSSRSTNSSSSLISSAQQQTHDGSIKYADVIERSELALLGLMRTAPEVFVDGDIDIKGLNEIDGFIARFESIQHKLNAYCKRADSNFAVSYIKTLSINFAKVSKVKIDPWNMYGYFASIYPYLGVTVEQGVQLSCAECSNLIVKRKREHPEEEAFLRQVEYLFRNGLAKKEWDIVLEYGAQGLVPLKINPKDIEHYFYLITFTNGMKEELSEFKRNNPTCVGLSPVTSSVVSSNNDLSDHAFALEDTKD